MTVCKDPYSMKLTSILFMAGLNKSQVPGVTEQYTANWLAISTLEVLFPVLITLLHVCADHKDFYFGNKLYCAFEISHQSSMETIFVNIITSCTIGTVQQSDTAFIHVLKYGESLL